MLRNRVSLSVCILGRNFTRTTEGDAGISECCGLRLDLPRTRAREGGIFAARICISV